MLAQFGITREENTVEIPPVIHIPEPHSGLDASALEVPPYQRIPRKKRLSKHCPLVFGVAFKEGDEFACGSALARSPIRLRRCVSLPPKRTPRRNQTVSSQGMPFCVSVGVWSG